MLFFKDLNSLADRCTAKWVSTICSSVISRYQRIICNFFCHRKCADRNTASDCFRHCHDIRCDSHLLPCKPCTASSHTTLYFIADHQDSVLITDLTDSLHKFFCRCVDSAFALDCFQNNRAGLIIYQCFYTVKIIVDCKMYTRHNRFKWLSVFFVSGKCYCTHTSAVE